MVKNAKIKVEEVGKIELDMPIPCIEVTRNYQKTVQKFVYYGNIMQVVIFLIGFIDVCLESLKGDVPIIGFSVLISTTVFGLIGREFDKKSKKYVEEIEKSC